MNSPAPQCRFRVFGGFAVEGGKTGKFRTRKTASLAAFLALRPGKFYSRDRLCELFWSEDDSDNPRQSLRMALSALRASLGDVVKTDGDQVCFDREQVVSDYQQFLSICDAASKEDSKQLFDKAFELADGEFCEGLEGDWILAERQEFEENFTEYAVQYLKICGQLDEIASGLSLGNRALKLVGYKEDLTAELIAFCIKSGFYTQALAHFENLEKELVERWGQQPSQKTIELLDSIPLQPRQSKALVGRQAEFQELVQKFYSSKSGSIVCLTGPGGIGKTTLARAVLRELDTAGRWVKFVDLTSANSFNSALRIISTVLQLGEIDLADAPKAIAKTLVAQNGVCALDNLEQLGADADLLVKELNLASDRLNLILTTRNKIEIDGLEEVEIRPLDIPDIKANLDIVRFSSSAQLFEKRAAYASQGFSINKTNASAVAELCLKLDGLPLALEIAAAKVVVQSPAQILEQIQKSLISLEKKHGAKSPRHSSINAAIEWSVGLLEDHERIAALRLSLFNGRFSVRQAQMLTESKDILGILEVLVRASLLNSDSTGEESQFWMYETVRLSFHDIYKDEEALLAARHRHFDITIQRLKEIQTIKDQPTWKILQMDLALSPDALDCMEFFVDRDERSKDVAEAAIRIQEVCRVFGMHDRNAKCMESVLEKDLEPNIWALLGLAVVRTNANQGSNEDKLAFLYKCLEAGKDDKSILLEVKSQMITLLRVLGRLDEAQEQLDWIEKNCPEDNHALLSWNYYLQNHVAFIRGDRESTLYNLERALEFARRHDDINRLIRILFDYGSELAFHKRFDESMEMFEEAIAHSQRIRSLKLEGLTRWQYGDALINMKRHREAVEMLLKSVDLVYESNYHVAEKWIFLKTAEAAVAVGLDEVSARLIGKGLHVRTIEKRVFAHSEEEDLKRCRETLIHRLGRARFEELTAAGRDSSWAELWSQARTATESL